MRWFLHSLKAYTHFSGRASRAEFWGFWLVVFGLESIARCLMIVWPLPGLFLMWSIMLLTASPLLAVSNRRLHDTGRTGWLLAKSAALGAAQLAFWLGVALSHGKDALAWAAALAAAGAHLAVSMILFYFYCQPGDPGTNAFGPPPPASPKEKS